MLRAKWGVHEVSKWQQNPFHSLFREDPNPTLCQFSSDGVASHWYLCFSPQRCGGAEEGGRSPNLCGADVLTDSCPWHHFLSATRPKQCWSWGYAEIYCPVPFAPYPFLIVQLHLWHSSISLPSLAITNLSLTLLATCLWWHPSWDSACASLQLLSLPPLTSWLKFPTPKPFYKKFKSWHVTMSESQYFLCLFFIS